MDRFCLPVGRADRTALAGVMAQEVQKIEPSAVWRDHDGYLAVNYDRIGLSLRGARALLSRSEHQSLYRGKHAKLVRLTRRGGTRTKGLLPLGMEGSSALPELGRGDIGGIATRFDGRLAPLQSRSLLLHIVTIVSLVIVAVSGLPRSFAAEQPAGRPGLAAGPCRRRRRSNRTSGFAEGARALPAKSERRRGEESLLLRHGRHAPRRVWAAVLRYLRSRPVVSRGSIGSRQRPQFERHREFRQRTCAARRTSAMRWIPS